MTPGTLDYATTEDAPDGSHWGWAAYLGASWTWCIGMYLPVLLVRDYGPWAWVVFAVPNVVGAAAMGWVMRTRDASRRYVADHASACRLFSFVTIAFQLFFALWMLPRLVGVAGYGAGIVIAQSAFTPLTKSKGLRVGGAVALAVSAMIAVALTSQSALQWPAGTGRPYAYPRPLGSFDTGEALGLSLVCLAGFLTCPYLDLTFHRARAATSDADAKVAFGVGFGVLFASMIVFTFFYAHPLVWLSYPFAGGSWHGLAAGLIALHLFVQMTYTVHAHAAELGRQADLRDDRGTMRAGLSAWLAIGFVTGLASTFVRSRGLPLSELWTGENAYRLFMSAYGLIFPAYVLLTVRRSSVNAFGWACVVVAAAGFYWLAFIEKRMAFGSAGVLVLVFGVIAVRQITPRARALPIARSE